MSHQGIGLPPARGQLFDRLGDERRFRLIEEHPGLPFDRRVQESAPAEGGGGLAEGSRLHRSQSEVLVGGGHQTDRRPVEPTEAGVVDPPERRHVGRGGGADLVSQRPGSHDHQAEVGKPAKGLGHVLDVLVGEQTGDAQEEAGLDPRDLLPARRRDPRRSAGGPPPPRSRRGRPPAGARRWSSPGSDGPTPPLDYPTGARAGSTSDKSLPAAAGLPAR